MTPMAAQRIETNERWLIRSRRRIGVAALVVGVAGWATWLVWRVQTLTLHPVPIVMLLIELSGLAAGVSVTIGLLNSVGPRSAMYVADGDAHRYAVAVADHVGRTTTDDLRRDMKSVVDRLRAHELAGPTDRAVVAVMTDGPRRIVFVVGLSVALLVGVAPFPMPPAWAVVGVVAGLVAVSASHVILTSGRIRFGDRTRWSFAALGEVLAPNEPDGVAPRRWVGTIGTVVALNLAIGLRGISDQWTHGLPAMSHDDRVAAMLLAIVAVAGALYTLRTMPPPVPSREPVAPRRLEERTARRSALGGAVCVGLVGLIAGILPTGVDAAAGDTTRVEAVTEADVVVRD